MINKTKLLIIGLFVTFFSTMGHAIISDTYDIRFTNTSDLTRYNVINQFVNQDPDPAEPGEYVDVRFKVENFGRANAENVIVELIPEFPFSLRPGDDAQRKIGSVWGRQIGDKGVIVHYKLKVAENAVEGNNEINVRYSLDNGRIWNMFEPFNIRVEPRDIILAIDSVISEPKIVKPGEKVKLDIKLKNLANSIIKNIKLNLEVITTLTTTTTMSYQEAPFSPVGSSNEKTLLELKGKEEKIVSFDLVADPDSESGVYKIPLILTYSDKLNNNYSNTDLISLIVGDEPELIVSLDQTNIKKVGSNGEISVKFVNKGVTDIKFLYVKLHESPYYEILSSDESYLGNIDSDDYETADFKLYVKSSDNSTITFPLYIEYKDANNNDYAIKKNLKMRLYSNREIKEFELEKGNNSIGIIIVIIIVVGGVFLYRYWRKRKKSKS